MRINIVHVSRCPQWPIWAVLLVLLWLALGCSAILLNSHYNQHVDLCLFKKLTGIPCPTCGFSRGGISFLQGRIIRAWLFNPLLFSILGLLLAVVAARLVFGRSLQVRMTRNERIAAWILAAVAACLNWAYVILYVK